MTETDAQIAYSQFYKDLKGIYDTCFPVKTFKQGYRTRKPWLSEEMKRAIKLKNKLYRKSKKSDNPEHEIHYKRFKNSLNKKLIQQEKEHYDNLLNENKSNMKKSWRILKVYYAE